MKPTILSALAPVAAMACLAMPAYAQEHEHGGNLPDWYDPSCCNQRDCKPVKDEDIEFGTNEFGNYARYKPTGHTFYRNQFKLSQDERYHVCINQNAVETMGGTAGALCFYDRTGV